MKKKTAIIASLVLLAVGAVVWSQDGMPTLGIVHSSDSAIVLSGQAQLSSGQATVSLPAWFESAVKAEGRSIQLTCRGGFSPLWASAVSNGQFTVSTNGSGDSSQQFWWEVRGSLR